MPGTLHYALLVDPDPGRLGLYTHLAQSHGLEAVTVRDGEAALAIAAGRSAPGLVITELNLPKLDGFAFVSQLRARGVRAPVLAISRFMGLRTEATRRRSELGLAAVLSSSSPTASLDRAIRAALAAAPVDEAPEPSGTYVADSARIAEAEHYAQQDDPAADEVLQRVCAEALVSSGAETAFVSFVLADRQWIKTFAGEGGAMGARDVPLEHSFCRHAVDARAPLFIPDARTHPLMASNPMVTSGHVRGYAGMPLETPSGAVVGTLCVIDRKPLRLGVEQVVNLRMLARRIAGELELREARRQRPAAVPLAPGTAPAVPQYLGAVLDALDAAVLLMVGEPRTFFYANQAAARLAGVPVSQIVGMTRDQWLARLATFFDDPAEVVEKLGALSDGPFAGREEFALQRPDPRVLRWTAKPVVLDSGVGQLAVYEDITEAHRLRAALEQQAVTDELTGLSNRRGARATLERELARARRRGTPLHFCLLDLDHFKAINDRHGHPAGDELLRQSARALASSFRASDLVARWGGEEFLVVMADLDAEAARAAAERARLQIAQLSLPDLPPVTISGGLAQWEPGEDVNLTIARADARLYTSKAAGRNRIT